MRAPIIGLFDAGGAAFRKALQALGGYGEVFKRNVSKLGRHSADFCHHGSLRRAATSIRQAMTDFIFMVRDASYMFVTGPDVVKTVTNETVTAEELGGAKVHTDEILRCGQGAWDNDVEALLQSAPADRFPAGEQHGRRCPHWPGFDEAERIDLSLDTLVPDNPNKPYDMKELITEARRRKRLFRIQEGLCHATSSTGFGRIEGRTVGIVANQPMVLAGVLDSDASRKAARFVRFCDAFEIPIVTLVDVPGFLPGTAQGYGGLIKHGAKLLFASLAKPPSRLSPSSRARPLAAPMM